MHGLESLCSRLQTACVHASLLCIEQRNSAPSLPLHITPFVSLSPEMSSHITHGVLRKMNDREAMQVALTCALRVEGRTSPRPPVGAALVRAGALIATGATAPPYGPHAEIQALQTAGRAAEGATLYVTLEPCCVHIHTPPCTTAIISAGIHRVVVGSQDPNPCVCGKGIALLRAAGIIVELFDELPLIRELIAPFATYITRNRPFVTAKWAMTLDGKIATCTGDARWISGPPSQQWTHNLRDRVDAILVGAGTARRDNPQLTVRLTPSIPRTVRLRGPMRVVLATQGQLPANLSLLQPDEYTSTCVIVGETCPSSQQEWLSAHGVDVIAVGLDDAGHVDLSEALQALAQRGLMHVLLEGGMQLLGEAFAHHFIDHVAVFIAPKLIGGHAAPTPLGGRGIAQMANALSLQTVQIQQIGNDLLIEGEL